MFTAIFLAPWMIPAAVYTAVSYFEDKSSLTFEKLITYYLDGAHPDDIHKELVPIKQKQLQKFLRKNATKNRIYVPPEIVKLISNFSALNLRNEKKLNELRACKMSVCLGVMLELAYWEKERMKHLKYYLSLEEVLFAYICRIIKYDFKGIECQKLRRKVEFDAEVNLLMIYYYGMFKRLFTFKTDSKKELKIFSMFHEKPLARMKLLEKRRWRINKNEATRLVKQVSGKKRLFSISYKKDPQKDPLFDEQSMFNYKALPNLPQRFS